MEKNGHIQIRECRALMENCRKNIDENMGTIHKRVDKVEARHTTFLYLLIGNLFVGVTTLGGIVITQLWGRL